MCSPSMELRLIITATENLAHSSSVRGIVVDGENVFSVGLDGILRRWVIKYLPAFYQLLRD